MHLRNGNTLLKENCNKDYLEPFCSVNGQPTHEQFEERQCLMLTS